MPLNTDQHNSPALQPTSLTTGCNKEVRITLNKLSISGNQKFLVSQNIVVNSRKAAPSIEKEEVKCRAIDDTVIYSSDDTEAYWPLDPMKQILLFPKINVQYGCATSVLKPSYVHRFNICVHGIRHRKLHYYFKCVAAGCVKTFNKYVTGTCTIV